MKRRDRRIYYGPPGFERSKWWTVKVRDAKQDVTLNGRMEHVLKSRAGVDVGCTVSNMGADEKNSSAFPHPVHYVVVHKNSALVVDSLKKNGDPKTAVLYAHSYGAIVDKNDDRSIKKFALEHPDIIERSFTLRVPRKSVAPHGPNGTWANESKRKHGTGPRSYMPRGALRRAVKAGLIGNHIAEQMKKTAGR